jgi:hypothetical protein
MKGTVLSGTNSRLHGTGNLFPGTETLLLGTDALFKGTDKLSSAIENLFLTDNLSHACELTCYFKWRRYSLT